MVDWHRETMCCVWNVKHVELEPLNCTTGSLLSITGSEQIKRLGTVSEIYEWFGMYTEKCFINEWLKGALSVSISTHVLNIINTKFKRQSKAQLNWLAKKKNLLTLNLLDEP